MHQHAVSINRTNRAAFFLVMIMLMALLPMMTPTVSAEGIRLSVSPGSQEVNPGDSGEYTIRVTNDYPDPITVQLGSEEDPSNNECSNFNSVLLQTTLQIEGYSEEETTMNVTVSQTAEADMECDTTVTAEVTAVFGAPGSPEPTLPEPQTSTVTTIASDGSGGAIWGVDLYFDGDEELNDKTLSYDPSVGDLEYFITVENTGQQNSTSVNLTLNERDDSGCGNANELTATLDKNSVTLDTEDGENTEIVTVTIEVPDGQQADDYCWEVIGTVTTPNPTEEVKDTVNLNLEVPVLKECTMTLSKDSFTLDPGQQGDLTATISNDGNSDWTVSLSVKKGTTPDTTSWISFDGPSSGNLPYDGGSGTKSFDLLVTPDDSVDANSANKVRLEAKDGNTPKCMAEITVIPGQTYGAELSLSRSSIGPIEPGENSTSSLTVTNTGNGPDSLRLTVSSAPPGWDVELDQSTVSVESRHGDGKSVIVEFTVSVPIDALATESIELTFSVLPNGGGSAYQTKILTITVKETHGMSTESIIPKDNQGYVSQTGDYNEILVFPLAVENLGNNDDVFRFYVKQQRSSTGSDWDISFTDSEGEIKTEFNVPAREEMTINVNVLVPDVGNYNTNDITIEVINLEDSNNADDNGDGLPDNKAQFEIRAIKNNITYSMDARFGEGEYDSVNIGYTSASVILAPEGSMSFDFWIENVGTPQIGPSGLLREDLAVIDITGLEGIATRQILVDELEYEGSIPVTTTYGIFNLTSQTYITDDNGVPYSAQSEVGASDFFLAPYNISAHGNEVRKFKQKVTVIIDVSPTAVTGESGILEIVVFSQDNAADRETGKITLNLEIQTIYDVRFDEGIQTFYQLEYPNRQEVPIPIVNQGNTKTQFIIYTPESFRGWSVELDRNNATCQDVTEGLKCWLEVGEAEVITAIVRPAYDAEIKDNYTFTLAVEPVEIGVIGRENIEISVLGQPDDGPLGLGLSQGQIESGVYLIIAILFAGILYRAGKPSIDQFVQSGRNKNRLIYAEKLIASREQGFTPNSAFTNNPVPYRSAKLEWFLLAPLTLGLYGLLANYRIARDLKKHANIGPGGGKHLLLMIIPLWNIIRMFQFVGQIRQLEKATKHSTKLSTKSPIIWLLLSLSIFPAIGAGLLYLGIIGLLPIFLLTPTAIAQGLAYGMYFVILWYIAAYPICRIWKMMQDSLNASWAIWFGKI